MKSFVAVLDLASDPLVSGERIVLEVQNHWVAIFNISDNYYAIEDVCTHDGGPLADGELDGVEIACPRHGARFDVKTGKHLGFPATKDAPHYLTRVQNNVLEIAI
ncbi:non-heme iron oxygenase ferredoxin subunit [Corallococcus praedator]|uniref:Non-heme iron oxygenase ferredoxin subunit n=1 Tax=Corallococcus praedator TaxID=2316724 RepID=A0ABX9Q534_9BACT|nr:Rieske 2Fe-2S domain-containing protein [Corallococcus praedator]RKH84749.1 non-heme iron oxygenase ferredoxin subunit [Corallococcus praedator]